MLEAASEAQVQRRRQLHGTQHKVEGRDAVGDENQLDHGPHDEQRAGDYRQLYYAFPKRYIVRGVIPLPFIFLSVDIVVAYHIVKSAGPWGQLHFKISFFSCKQHGVYEYYSQTFYAFGGEDFYRSV